MYVIYNLYTAVQAEVQFARKNLLQTICLHGAPKPVGCIISSETWQHLVSFNQKVRSETESLQSVLNP